MQRLVRASKSFYVGIFRRRRRSLSHVGRAGGGNLTSGCRQYHVGILRRGGDLGDPSTVALQGPPQCHLLGHFYKVRWCLSEGWTRIFRDPENPKPSSQLGTEEKEVETRMQKLNGVSGLQRILGNVDFIFLKRLYGKEDEERIIEILTEPLHL